MPVDRETVKLAYQLVLGRDPESDEVIDLYVDFPNAIELGKHFQDSTEFKDKQAGAISQSKWVAVDVLDRFVQWVDLHDRNVSYGCLHNSWEASETEYFQSVLNFGDTVLDIGANIGWFTLVAAKKIGNQGTIHSFEPRPATLSALKRTISDNRLQSCVTVWPHALSDEASLVDLFWAPNTDNPGGSTFGDASYRAAGFESAQVVAVRLDDLLPDIAPDVVKIDVEGAEPKALKGAVQALARKHPPILSELHATQLKIVSGITPEEYIAWFGTLGYACYHLQDGRPRDRLHGLPSDSQGGLASVVFEWRAGLA